MFFFLVSFSWIWRQVGVCVNLLLGFKSTCIETNKHTNQPVKKRSSTFLKRSFSKTVEFLLHFPSCDIYTSYGCGVLNGCQRHGALWQDQDHNCSSFMSSAVFSPPLFLCAWFLLLFASLPEPVESSQNHLRNHFFAVPSRIIRTSGFHMED